MTNRGNRPEKQQSGSSTGLLIGLLFGFVVGLGILKERHQSLKNSFFPYAIGIGVIICSVVGYKIGALKDDEIYRDKCLGIHHITTKQWNDGNHWAIESTWKEYDGLEHRLLTSLLDGEVVSIYNEVIIANHGFNSGSRNASKLHEEMKGDLVMKLKEGFVV